MIPYALAWVLGNAVCAVVNFFFPSSHTIVGWFPSMAGALVMVGNMAQSIDRFFPLATCLALVEATLSFEAAMLLLDMIVAAYRLIHPK